MLWLIYAVTFANIVWFILVVAAFTNPRTERFERNKQALNTWALHR